MDRGRSAAGLLLVSRDLKEAPLSWALVSDTPPEQDQTDTPQPFLRRVVGSRRRRSRRPRWARYLIRSSIVLLAVIVALAGSEAAFIAFRLHEVKRGKVAAPHHSSTKGPNVGVQTFLLVGSTSRCALNGKQATAFGSCAEGITGVNSDVILLLRADQRTHSVSVLSIPRDLAMNNVRPGQFYKIDAALADGPANSWQRSSRTSASRSTTSSS